MAKTKVCSGCKKRKSESRFGNRSDRKDGLQNYCNECKSSHFSKIHHSVDGYLRHTFNNMKKRVEGRSNRKDAHLWAGKPLLPKETFIEWSKNHPDFLKLFKRWTMADYDKKLSPSVNRINSKKGYTLDNIEWVTQSQNSSLAGAARSFNQRTAIYSLLGER